jgi:hypothetical protein
MIPPDHEIYEVEKRIAARRHRVEAAARESGRRAMKALASPWAIAGAAAVGFLIAGGLRKDPREERHHERRRSDKGAKAAKAGGFASIAMAAASWVIKSQFGSPVAMAQFLMTKMKNRGAQPASPRADIRNHKVTSATYR